jgi:hypothetical protein
VLVNGNSQIGWDLSGGRSHGLTPQLLEATARTRWCGSGGAGRTVAGRPAPRAPPVTCPTALRLSYAHRRDPGPSPISYGGCPSVALAVPGAPPTGLAQVHVRVHRRTWPPVLPPQLPLAGPPDKVHCRPSWAGHREGMPTPANRPFAGGGSTARHVPQLRTGNTHRLHRGGVAPRRHRIQDPARATGELPGRMPALSSQPTAPAWSGRLSSVVARPG